MTRAAPWTMICGLASCWLVVCPPAEAQSGPALSPARPAVNAVPLEAGANSFTVEQARARLEQAGLTEVTDLKLDRLGVWRARAMRNGSAVSVGLDYRGAISVE
jgi:hypothetical protein